MTAEKLNKQTRQLMLDKNISVKNIADKMGKRQSEVSRLLGLSNYKANQLKVLNIVKRMKSNG